MGSSHGRPHRLWARIASVIHHLRDAGVGGNAQNGMRLDTRGVANWVMEPSTAILGVSVREALSQRVLCILSQNSSRSPASNPTKSSMASVTLQAAMYSGGREPASASHYSASAHIMGSRAMGGEKGWGTLGV